MPKGLSVSGWILKTRICTLHPTISSPLVLFLTHQSEALVRLCSLSALRKIMFIPRYWCQMLHTSSPQNAEVLLSFSGNSQNREKQPLFWCFTICITWLCVRVSLNLSGKHLRVCVWPSLFAQYVTLHSLSQKLPLPSIPEISLFDTYQAKPNPYIKTTLYGPLNFYPLSHLLSHPTEFPSPFPGTVTNK